METSLARMDDWSMEQVVAFCEMLSKSGYFHDARSAPQAFVKIMYGRELGISPIVSMKNIFVDDRGGISLSAGLIAGKILNSARYTYQVIETTALRCEIAFFRIMSNGERVLCGPNIALTIAQARASNMHMQWSSKEGAFKEKATWKNYPEDMLFARCLTRGQRRYCPDLFLGPAYTPDELAGDRAPAEVVDAEPAALQIEPPAPAQPEPPAEPEPEKRPDPTPPEKMEQGTGNGDGKRKKLATVHGGAMDEWKSRATAFAEAHPHYSMPTGGPNMNHLLGFAASRGISLVNLGNIAELFEALEHHAADKAAQAATE